MSRGPAALQATAEAGGARSAVARTLRAIRSDDTAIAAITVAAALYTYNWGSPYLQTIVIDSITIMVLAYSWNIISGYTGYFSFGQVAFYGIGAYALSALMTKVNVSWQLGLLLAMVIGAVAAIPLGWVLLRLRGIYFALGTLALAVVLSLIANDTSWLGKGQGVSLSLTASFNTILLAAFAIGAVAIATSFALSHSRLGLRARALSADEDAIKALGIRTMRVKLTMFVISAALAALAGAVGALNVAFVMPDTAFSDSINVQCIVYTLIGGVGTVWGPLLGTGVAQAIVTQFGPSAATEVEIVLGLLIVVIVGLTPGGIAGALNHIGLLRRKVMLRQRHQGTMTIAPGWLRRHAGNGHEAAGQVLLECSRVTMQFGGVTAVDGVDLRVREGEFIAVIGPNGAGKTSLFNAISGYVRSTSGNIRLAGQDISRLDATRLARVGISRTFQISRLAEGLTVWENVLLGSLLGSGLREAQDRASLIIQAIGLQDVIYQQVERLGPGTRRRVEIARAVASRPRVVLLDEALAGMSAEELAEVREAVGALREWGAEAVVSVEHVLSAVRDLADRMIALDFGQIVAEGIPEDVLTHQAVLSSYLGVSAGGKEPGGKEVVNDSDLKGRASRSERSGGPVMKVSDLVAGYGATRVLWNIELALEAGDFVGVLGASGAGKTTLCRALTGGCTVHSGAVMLYSEEITRRRPHLIARMGVAHVPSSRELFADLSVGDNLRLGAAAWTGDLTEQLLREALDLFPELRPLIRAHARALSGGQQQMVAVARALMRQPKLLVLDEPSTGLAPVIVRRLMEALRSLANGGVAVLVAEQNAVETLHAIDRACVLREGRIVFAGSARELRDDPHLVRAYLGASPEQGHELPGSSPRGTPV